MKEKGGKSEEGRDIFVAMGEEKVELSQGLRGEFRRAGRWNIVAVWSQKYIYVEAMERGGEVGSENGGDPFGRDEVVNSVEMWYQPQVYY